MKKDIAFPKVEGVKVAIVFEQNEEAEFPLWNVYLLNELSEAIEGVMISAKGYGFKEGQPQKTAILRHSLGKILPQNHAMIEAISEEVFHLNNEYWVSYFIDNQLFDKKFIFLPESIIKQNVVYIKALGKYGILHE